LDLYAITEKRGLVKMTRCPQSTVWRSYSLAMSQVKGKGYFEFYSFTTQVTAEDERNLPVPFAKLKIRTTSPCGVYINGAYQTLNENSQEVSTNSRGALSIVQEVKELDACSFVVKSDQLGEHIINPFHKILERLGKIRSGQDLANLGLMQSSDIISVIFEE
jgi:hypothetical protein